MARDFGCMEAFGCARGQSSSLRCPLSRALMVMELMVDKNLALGDAFRLCTRKEGEGIKANETLATLLNFVPDYLKKKQGVRHG